MSTLNNIKNNESYKNIRKNSIDTEKIKTKKYIDEILSMIDFDNINEINILSGKIENIFLELFDGGNIDNLQAIEIFEYLLGKLNNANFENVKKAYEILLIIFSVYLYENNKLEDFKDKLVSYFKLNKFEDYFLFINKYIKNLDKPWIISRIILKYISILINYNQDVYLLLSGKIKSKNFLQKIQEKFRLDDTNINNLINNLLKKDILDLNKKKIIFKYMNTFFSFNNYNYLFLHIGINNEITIKEKNEISGLLNLYINNLKKYILLIMKEDNYIANISYRSAVVLYTNIAFLLKLLRKDDIDKYNVKLFFNKFKSLFIKKYSNELEESFKNNDEYSRFLYYYTGEKFKNGNFVKEGNYDNNNVNILNLIDSKQLGEDLFILANTIEAYINIKKSAKVGLILMPSSEKNKILVNQKILNNIQYYNNKLKNYFIKEVSQVPLSLAIDNFLKYLKLILNIEYNKEDIALKFFIDNKFLSNRKILEEYSLNIDIDTLDTVKGKVNNYIMIDDGLYLKFILKTIYGDTDFILKINAKNIKRENISNLQILDIKNVGEKLAERILNYFNDINNFKEKILDLKQNHKETFDHMTNMGKLTYLLGDLIEDDDLKKMEQYYKEQFLLLEKKDIYKILGYMHDIGKANIIERLNRYSFINPRVDFIQKFYDAFIYIFNNPEKVKTSNLKPISIDSFNKNLDIVKENVHNDTRLTERIHKIIKNAEIISIDEDFYTKLLKEIIYFSVLRYENLSFGIGDEKIINDNYNYDTIKIDLIKGDKRYLKEIGKIEFLDINKFLWIVLGLIKLILDKIIEKIQYPHIQECFDFVKIHNTFISLSSSFFHHNYPSLGELERNGIMDILKNNYKNMGLGKYLKKLEKINFKEDEPYPDDIKDPIMVITTIADIIEALVISHRGYQKDKNDIQKLKSNIDKLHINDGLKKIFFDNLDAESKGVSYSQYEIVLKILDNIFKNNDFYNKIRHILTSKGFIDKVKSIKKI